MCMLVIISWKLDCDYFLIPQPDLKDIKFSHNNQFYCLYIKIKLYKYLQLPWALCSFITEFFVQGKLVKESSEMEELKKTLEE